MSDAQQNHEYKSTVNRLLENYPEVLRTQRLKQLERMEEEITNKEENGDDMLDVIDTLTRVATVSQCYIS